MGPTIAGITTDLLTCTVEYILPEAIKIPLNGGVAVAARKSTTSIGRLN